MDKLIKLKKRSQIERLIIAEMLLASVWEEMKNGNIEDDLMQTAVYVQIDINRIVWKLNELNNGGDKDAEIH